MKMLQSSFTRVLTASARSCWSGKFAQSDAGQPPTGPIFAHRHSATHQPLGFSPDFARYLQQLHASVNTYLAIQVGNPKEAGDAMLVFFSVSLSLSLLAKNIFMAATHKSQKVPNVICLPFLFAFFHAVYFCLGAINPFLLLFRLWDNKLLWQKAFNGLATKFRNFFAICRHHNNLRLINQKFSLPQKRLEMNLMNIGRWRANQIVVESFWLAIKLILMSSARVCQFLGNTLRFGSRN